MSGPREEGAEGRAEGHQLRTLKDWAEGRWVQGLEGKDGSPLGTGRRWETLAWVGVMTGDGEDGE